MRILLLGASGFLGGHVARLLGSAPGTRLVTAGRPGAGEVTVDLATDSPGQLARVLSRVAPDAVVNCAGAVGGSTLHQAAVNARGPAALCEAMAEAAPGARLVHLGSAAEYGPVPQGEPASEDFPARPVGLYGATKLAGTLAVTAAPLDAVVLRVTNPVGAGAPAASLPGRVASQLRELGTGPGRVRTGDLSAWRDFVDVRDVARAVELALTASGPLPPVVNIGSGRALRVREFVHLLLAEAGFGGRIEEAAAPGSARSAQVPYSCADITTAARALGFVPRLSPADSAAALWATTSTPADTGGGAAVRSPLAALPGPARLTRPLAAGGSPAADGRASLPGAASVRALPGGGS